MNSIWRALGKDIRQSFGHVGKSIRYGFEITSALFTISVNNFRSPFKYRNLLISYYHQVLSVGIYKSIINLSIIGKKSKNLLIFQSLKIFLWSFSIHRLIQFRGQFLEIFKLRYITYIENQFDSRTKLKKHKM